MSDKVMVNAKNKESKKAEAGLQSSRTDKSAITSMGRIQFLQRTVGNRTVQRLLKSGPVRGKLRIGQPNDIYEQEADRVADQVMRMSESKIRMKPT